jgi:hypothetical protein
MVEGDGWSSRRKANWKTAVFFCAGTEIKGDMFQILCTLCGSAASVHARDMSKYKPVSPKMGNIPKMGTNYSVTILNRDKVQVVRRQRREFVDRRPIWCPIIPNTYFVARRKGQVFITGNTGVQGGSASLFNEGLLRLAPRMPPDSHLILQVHDAVYAEVREDRAEEVKQLMIECLETTLGFKGNSCHFTVDAKIGKRWDQV